MTLPPALRTRLLRAVTGPLTRGNRHSTPREVRLPDGSRWWAASSRSTIVATPVAPSTTFEPHEVVKEGASSPLGVMIERGIDLLAQRGEERPTPFRGALRDAVGARLPPLHRELSRVLAVRADGHERVFDVRVLRWGFYFGVRAGGKGAVLVAVEADPMGMLAMLGGRDVPLLALTMPMRPEAWEELARLDLP